MAGRKTIDLSINREPEERPEPRMMQFEPIKETPKKDRKRIIKWVIFALLLLTIFKVLVYFNIIPSASFPSVDSNKIQAVYLSNNLMYFGHLKEVNRSYVAIEGPYYIQQQTAGSQDKQQGLNLVKIEQELQRPENKIFIPKSQILFWENLKAESPISKLILNPTSQGK